ncbi:MAG: hypothetical protein LC645_07625 [Geobacteraceae bacterium]|nr:hypothetical protein [Geobacteraceae bacterium]
MHDELTFDKERTETIRELSDLLFVVQQMGHRLADETHGDNYALVQELNETLHHARTCMATLEEQEQPQEPGTR